MVAGLISKADSRSLSGYPFLSRVPVATLRGRRARQECE